MRLVALLRPPPNLDDAVRLLGEAVGIPPAQARMRLSPEPPALLAKLPDPEAEALSGRLRGAGLVVLNCDAEVPGDSDRTVVRTLELGEETATFAPRTGEPLQIGYAEVQVILRGLRAQREETTRTEERKRLSVGMAVATGGLKLTRKEKKTVRSSDEETEQALFVYGASGACAAIYDGEFLFSCLGPAMQPSKLANMVALSRLLRERAPTAVYDDRLLRLGRRGLPFVADREERDASTKTIRLRSDTAPALDVLAEILWRGFTEGLLPSPGPSHG